MKKHNKRGFTIVELVIVIAVIAILAAVLIPTFANLIKKAKLSADQQVVRNMNIALQAEEAEGKPTEMRGERGVFELLEANGFKVPTSPSSKDFEYFWIKAENRVVLVEMNGGTIKAVVYPEDLAERYSSVSETTEWFCLSNALTAEEVGKVAEGNVYKVGNKYYKNITELLADPEAMTEGSTIKILDDVETNSSFSLGEGVESMTVDLSGNNISFFVDDRGDSTGIRVNGTSTKTRGSVTIQNGNLQGYCGGSSNPIIHSKYGAFILKNVTVTCLGPVNYTFTYAVVTVDCGEQKNYIYDSNITGDVYCSSGSTLEIYDTVIDGNLNTATIQLMIHKTSCTLPVRL